MLIKLTNKSSEEEERRGFVYVRADAIASITDWGDGVGSWITMAGNSNLRVVESPEQVAALVNETAQHRFQSEFNSKTREEAEREVLGLPVHPVSKDGLAILQRCWQHLQEWDHETTQDRNLKLFLRQYRIHLECAHTPPAGSTEESMMSMALDLLKLAKLSHDAHKAGKR